MNISFQRKVGAPSLDVRFFWKMTIEAKSSIVVTDHFIPELFFDFFFVKEERSNALKKYEAQNSPCPGRH